MHIAAVKRRRRDEGMVLLNVLIIVALASAVATVMILAREAATTRTVSFFEASQAKALLEGGELTVASALRRDSLVAAQTDHLREDWAQQVSQAETVIAGGRFALSVVDGQSLFNLNTVASGAPSQLAMWARIAAQAGLDPAAAEHARLFISAHAPLTRLSELGAAGLTPSAIERLSHLVTALPGATSVNLNTAPEPLFAMLVEDQRQASALLGRRRRLGYLTPSDFAGVGASLPAETGFTTNFVWVRTVAQIGDTRLVRRSLIERRDSAAAVVQRERSE